MPFVRIRPLAAALCCACLSVGVQAEGFTAEGETLLATLQQRGPVALAADGRWLAYGDGAGVLHRVNVVEHTEAHTFALGEPVRGLAASRAAQRVAFSTPDGCVGVVDFAAATPAVSWRQVGEADGRVLPELAQWTPARPADCRVAGSPLTDADQLALSADGRLLATPDGVVDLDAKRIVLVRPRAHALARPDVVLRLRFVDRDSKLAVVGATFGEAWEDVGSPSGLQASVWDLATHALWSFAELRDADLETPQGQFADIAPGGAVFWGDGTRRRAAVGKGDDLFDLMQWNAAACGQAPARRAVLQPWQWVSFVVDPRGRWIAGMRKVERTGATDELVVAELATGRTLVTRAFKHEVHGLAAAADGATIYGVSARAQRPGDAGPAPPAGPAAPLGELVTVAVPQGGPAAVPSPAGWSAAPCPVGDEAPDARRVERSARALAPVWTLPLVPETQPGSGGPANAAGADCDAWCGTLFAMRDGSVWLDRGAHIAALDPASGRIVRTLPTPRSDRIDSVPLPAAGGFFNGQGDTLSWRPFDAAAGGPAKRLVDVRPGQRVLRMARRESTVMVVWVRKPDAKTPRDPEGKPIFDEATYVLYDPDGKRLSEMPGHEQCDLACPEEPLRPELLRERAQPCRDERGPIATGLDWRPGPFDSVRAYACGPAPGAARLALWDGVDAAPRAGASSADPPGARLVAHEGAIGVVRVGNRLRVLDAASHRELGQVAIAHDGEREVVVVDPAHGLLLVASSEQEGDARQVLRAYRYR